MKTIQPYSFGIGDRFGRQGKAQLHALRKARAQGVEIVPVWNKSHREHSIIGTTPANTRTEADQAVQALDWNAPYFVDADHIGLHNVDAFLEASDFFTLDVADFIGKPAPAEIIKDWVHAHRAWIGTIAIDGLETPLSVTTEDLETIAATYALAVQEAGRIYRHIREYKGDDNFITEVSMDETNTPQSPVDMLFILAALAKEGIPAQTIAPKFTGRFNKGVDYVGEVEQFALEFRQDLAVIRFAVQEFGLPQNLKLSIHSGSDKFSLYAPVGAAIRETGAGLHLKTAGTTWLEEIIGLSLAGGSGLETAQTVYAQAYSRFDELCGPYATVIDINRKALPAPETVQAWSGQQLAAKVQHDPACPDFDPNIRQLLHVGYKVAAEMGDRYLAVLDEHEETIAATVTANLYERHIQPLFMPSA